MLCSFSDKPSTKMKPGFLEIDDAIGVVASGSKTKWFLENGPWNRWTEGLWTVIQNQNILVNYKNILLD